MLRCCALVLPPFSLTMATLDASQVVPGAAFDALVELVHGLQLPPVEAFHVAEAVVPAIEQVIHNYACAHKTVLDCIASMRSGWSCLASAASFAPSRAVQQSSRGASLPAAASSPDADVDVAALRSQIEHGNHAIAELQIQNENAKQRIEQLQQQVQELSAECQARIEGARNENEKLQLQVSELQALLSRAAARIVGKANVFDAAESGDIELVKDHVMVNAGCVLEADSRYDCLCHCPSPCSSVQFF